MAGNKPIGSYKHKPDTVYTDIPIAEPIKTDTVDVVPVGKNDKKAGNPEAERLYIEKYVLRALDREIAKYASYVSSAKDDTVRAEYEQKLEILKELKTEREAVASYKVSDDGENVVFKMKDGVPAERFKQMFFIEDGALREQLKAEYDSGEDNGVFEKSTFVLGFIPLNIVDYESALLTSGKEYTVPADKMPQGKELMSAIDDYVNLIINYNNGLGKK